jgi:chromosome segregation ATPase
MDDGNLVSIKGGEVSKPMIATPSCMHQVRSLGTPDELCMVLLLSSEQKLAISVGIPLNYVKTTLEEGKKLIDPNVDYKSSQTASSASIVTSQYESEINSLNVSIKEKDSEILSLTEKVAELEKLNESLKSEAGSTQLKDIKLQELTEGIEELKSKNTSYESEISGLESTLKSVTAERDTYKAKLDAVDEKIKLADKAYNQLEVKNQEIAKLTEELDVLKSNQSSDKSIELESEVNNLTAINEELKTNLTQCKSELDETKKNLSELITKAESMKSTMTSVCKKFNIKFDEVTGDWIQTVL